MTWTNHEGAEKALDLLRGDRVPFVERELQAQFGVEAKAKALRLAGDDRGVEDKLIPDWDVTALPQVVEGRTGCSAILWARLNSSRRKMWWPGPSQVSTAL